MIVINGQTFSGDSVNISGGRIIIDGVDQTPDNVSEIKISIQGNVEQLHVDHCKEISIVGDCNNVETKSGDIKLTGNVGNGLRSESGNIRIKGDVKGNISNMSGDVNLDGDINGSISTMSGDIDKKRF